MITYRSRSPASIWHSPHTLLSGFMLGFAYALEGLVMKLPLEASAFPISPSPTGQGDHGPLHL